MTKLPQLKPKLSFKALLKVGFYEIRRKGSHRDLHHPDCRRTAIPIHTKPVGKGLLHKILKQTELSFEELKKYL